MNKLDNFGAEQLPSMLQDISFLPLLSPKDRNNETAIQAFEILDWALMHIDSLEVTTRRFLTFLLSELSCSRSKDGSLQIGAYPPIPVDRFIAERLELLNRRLFTSYSEQGGVPELLPRQVLWKQTGWMDPATRSMLLQLSGLNEPNQLSVPPSQCSLHQRLEFPIADFFPAFMLEHPIVSKHIRARDLSDMWVHSNGSPNVPKKSRQAIQAFLQLIYWPNVAEMKKLLLLPREITSVKQLFDVALPFAGVSLDRAFEILRKSGCISGDETDCSDEVEGSDDEVKSSDKERDYKKYVIHPVVLATVGHVLDVFVDDSSRGFHQDFPSTAAEDFFKNWDEKDVEGNKVKYSLSNQSCGKWNDRISALRFAGVTPYEFKCIVDKFQEMMNRLNDRKKSRKDCA